MSEHGDIHNQDIRDEMGASDIFPEATQQKDSVTYSVILWNSFKLPVQYHNMIYSRWLRSLRHGNDWFKLIDSDEYYRNYHKVLENILDGPNEASIRLAVLSDDHDVVLGYSVCRGDCLDYVHVQKDFRGMGIGRALVPANINWISHLTHTGLRIWGSKMGGVKFNPFA